MNLSVCIFLDTRVKSSILNVYTMVQICFRVCNKRSSLSAFTAEQYQQHQEQLALMQKEQLEQIQLQQQANSTATANSTHVSIPRSLQVVGTPTAPISFFFLQWLKQFSPPPTGPGEYIGPGQRSVRRHSPSHRWPTAGSQNQGWARPGRRSEWRPLPLRYDDPPTHQGLVLVALVSALWKGGDWWQERVEHVLMVWTPHVRSESPIIVIAWVTILILFSIRWWLVLIINCIVCLWMFHYCQDMPMLIPTCDYLYLPKYN